MALNVTVGVVPVEEILKDYFNPRPLSTTGEGCRNVNFEHDFAEAISTGIARQVSTSADSIADKKIDVIKITSVD